MSVEDKLREMDLSLSEPNAPVANFVPSVRTGNLLYVAGHIGFMPDGSILHPGKVGRDVTEEQGYESARQAMLNCLAANTGCRCGRTSTSVPRPTRSVTAAM